MMDQVKFSTFILGTALASLAILAMVWFLGVSPALSEASEAKAETKTVTERNTTLRTETAELADEFNRLPDLQAKLAALHIQIPGDDEVSAFNRFIGEVAASRGVTILSVTADPAQMVLPLAPAADAASTSDPTAPALAEPGGVANLFARSEERRVGKECPV